MRRQRNGITGEWMTLGTMISIGLSLHPDRVLPTSNSYLRWVGANEMEKFSPLSLIIVGVWRRIRGLLTLPGTGEPMKSTRVSPCSTLFNPETVSIFPPNLLSIDMREMGPEADPNYQPFR